MTRSPSTSGMSRVVGDVVASATGAELREDPSSREPAGPPATPA